MPYDIGDLDDVELPDAITLNVFEEFVTVDQTAPCYGMPTDDEICVTVSAAVELLPGSLKPATNNPGSPRTAPWSLLDCLPLSLLPASLWSLISSLSPVS